RVPRLLRRQLFPERARLRGRSRRPRERGRRPAVLQPREGLAGPREIVAGVQPVPLDSPGGRGHPRPSGSRSLDRRGPRPYPRAVRGRRSGVGGRSLDVGPTATKETQLEGAVMSVKKEPSGRRSAQIEIEVPGTPEEVWQAIATGPGISSWMVPAEFEEKD